MEVSDVQHWPPLYFVYPSVLRELPILEVAQFLLFHAGVDFDLLPKCLEDLAAQKGRIF